MTETFLKAIVLRIFLHRIDFGKPNLFLGWSEILEGSQVGAINVDLEG